MGLDPFSQRKTLAFDGNQFLTCPMDWSTNDGYIDNLQVFIVFKYKNLPKTKEFRGGLLEIIMVGIKDLWLCKIVI